MTLTRRRRLIFTIVRCVLLTLIALALDWAGYLVKLEHGLYDFRAVHCQYYRPRPSGLLVHLDIDDTSLGEMGRFPWSRELMAELLDEIGLTQPKLVLMDILFAEPQEPYYDTGPDHTFHDPDTKFAESIRRLGVALVPCSLSFDAPEPPGSLKGLLVTLLARNPELSVEQCMEQLPHVANDESISIDEVKQAILSARPEALYRRIHSELAAGKTSRDKLKHQLLPHLDPTLTGSVLGGLFDQEYAKVTRERALSRFALNIPPGIPSVLRASDEITPILSLSNAAQFSGFVDYLPDHTEGTVRSVPMVANFNGRLVPHMSLAAACAALDVDVHTLRLSADSVTIPRPGGKDIVIPVSSRSTTDMGSVGFLMEVPMFGKRNGWLTMYDYPKLQTAAQHVSMYEVYRIFEQRERLKRNEATAGTRRGDVGAIKKEVFESQVVLPQDEAAIIESLSSTDPDAAKKYAATPLAGEPRLELVRSTANAIADLASGLAAVPDLDPGSKQLLQNYRTQEAKLRAIVKHYEPTTAPATQSATSDESQSIAATLDDIPSLKARLAIVINEVPAAREHAKLLMENLTIDENALTSILKQINVAQILIDSLRRKLREKLHGRAIFIGGTATTLADVRPTSLNFACPGIVIHGALFNAILTGKMWRVAPRWVPVLITILIGLLTGVIVSALSPLKAFLTAFALVVGYLLINGFYLFDKHNLIVGAAGPLMAGVLVWSGITLTDFIIEIAERNRITKRFRNYVDPTLVDWVLNHPEQTRFDGEARVMTMAFSDLVSFTAMTEHIGERAMPLLARYMGRMVPVIRAHKGYVSKLMGDGIYFFFGAPEPCADHALNAVSAVLGMHRALAKFNEEQRERGEPELGMRLGVSTGRVIIGDAGPEDASDYTAMGDVVNLASRLETANKVFGTKTLITNRTVELLGDKYLVRPIANLRVAGKTEGVPVFEPLSEGDSATPEQKRLAELTAHVVNAYQHGEFHECIAAADAMDHEIGPGKLTALYRKHATKDLAEPPESFDGQVVLTEK